MENDFLLFVTITFKAIKVTKFPSLLKIISGKNEFVSIFITLKYSFWNI